MGKVLQLEKNVSKTFGSLHSANWLVSTNQPFQELGVIFKIAC